MTFGEYIAVGLGLVALVVAFVSDGRLRRIANTELYEKLAIIDGYIDFIKTSQAVISSGAMYIVPTPAQNSYTLPFGKVINDVLGAIELKRFAERRLRKLLDERISELIKVASENQKYQELSNRLNLAVDDSDDISVNHAKSNERDRDYVMAQAFASFFIGMMFIAYGTLHSYIAATILGGAFWVLAIFFASGYIVSWSLRKALWMMKWASGAVFIGSLALVVVDWSKTINELANGHLGYEVLLWGGIAFFYLFSLVYGLSVLVPLFGWIRTLFSRQRGWIRRTDMEQPANQLIQDPNKKGQTKTSL